MANDYDEKAAAEFHARRNAMRLKLVAVLEHWFDGGLRIDPHSEMVMQLTDAALDLTVEPAKG